METSVVINKPVTQPAMIPVPREDYRRELNNAIRSTCFVAGYRHIFDTIEDEGIDEIDYENGWHRDPYALSNDDKVIAIDKDGYRHVYYGTDKGIVVFNETEDGVELDYPSALQFMISEVFSGLMN